MEQLKNSEDYVMNMTLCTVLKKEGYRIMLLNPQIIVWRCERYRSIGNCPFFKYEYKFWIDF